MAPPLTAIALQNAVMFAVYGNVLKIFPQTENRLLSALHVTAAGALAGVAQLWIISPTELVKIRLQSQDGCK